MSTDAWESRFPLMGGSPGVGVKRPGSTAPRAATPTAGGTRPRAPTPAEALEDAERQRKLTVDFSAAAIRPGSAMGHPMGTVPLPGRAQGTAVQVARQRAVAGVAGPGYHDFERAITRMHRRLHAVPLAERWATMAAWLDKYTHDAEAESLARTAAALHEEVGRRTGHLPSPSGLRTAVSFLVLEQVVHLIGRAMPCLGGVAETVTRDMAQAVYMDPDPDLSSSFFVLEDPTDMAAQQRLLERFYGRTFFQRLRDVSRTATSSAERFETEERGRNKQLRIMNRIVDYWQLATTGLMLRGWRGYVRGRKAKREKDRHAAQLQDLLEEAQAEVAEARSEQQMAARHTHREMAELRQETERLRTQLEAEQERSEDLSAKYVALHAQFEHDTRVAQLMQEVRGLRSEVLDLRAAAAKPSS